jgi:hypothetical protein
MSAKRELVAAIEALPEDITVEEAVERLYQLYKIKKGLAQRAAQGKPSDLSRHAGVIRLNEDPVVFQRQERDDWS